MTGLEISNSSDISNLFESISQIDKGSGLDTVINQYPQIKRNFLFLNLQEYYRQIENNHLLLQDFISKETPDHTRKILSICLTLLFFSKKPEFAIVHEAVEFSKRFKKDKLVNAVLRSLLRTKKKIDRSSQNLPKLFKANIDKVFSSKTIRAYIYNSLFHKPINYQISYNENKNSIYGGKVSLLEKDLHQDCFVQDIGNFECIYAIKDLFKSKNILDVCAAPGGKSILLSSYGFIVDAIDKSSSQIKKFNDNVNRLDLDLGIVQGDFLTSTFPKKYESILLDAPCSALGTFRRNPDVASKIDEKKLLSNQKIQVAMIEKSLKLLDKGGILSYIVCSFHPFETMSVIDKILQKHQDVSLLNIQSDKMIKKEKGYFINPYAFKDLGGSDIFFMSVLQKK